MLRSPLDSVTGIIVFFVATLSVWKTAQYISGFIEEQWLLDPQKRVLQEKFESWWLTVAEKKPRSFAVALARVASESLTSFFGKRLFSKRAFVRSATIGTGLLMASLAFSSVLEIGVNPWKQFQQTIDTIKKVSDRNDTKRVATDLKAKEEAEAAQYLKAIAEQYGGIHWKIIYCVAFFAALLVSNAISFFLSIGFSRLVLQEIVASGRIFAACSLLALNGFLVTSTATFFLLLLTVLAYPWLWFLVPLAYLLSTASIYWLLVVLFGGGIAVWAFGNPFLQMVSLIAFLPCFGAMLLCAISVVAQWNRNRFHTLCCSLLLRCTGKKPLSFIIGLLGGIGVVIALICKLIQAAF